MKKYIILAVVLVLGLSVLWWFYEHAYITVTISSSAGGGKYTYSLVNEKGKVTSVQTSQPSQRFLVTRGRYEVTVQQSETSFISSQKAGSFLSNNQVSASLQAENLRQYVGYNPSSCMTMVNGELMSDDCTGWYHSAVFHVPATADSPTYTMPASIPSIDKDGHLYGTVVTNEGSLALIKVSGFDENDGPYTINHLSNDTVLGSGTPLPGLAPNKQYSIIAYKSGFLVYDTSYTDLQYYSSTTASPQEISVEKPHSNYPAVDLSVNGDTITITYANVQNVESGSKTTKSEVETITDGSIQHYTLPDEPYPTVRSCGQSQLCVLSNNVLQIYTLKDGKLGSSYSLPDVQAIANGSSGLLAITAQGVINFDAAKAEGYYEYTMGSYNYCGIQQLPHGYVLCVTLPNSGSNGLNKAALYIDESAPNTDSIDKKIQALATKAEIGTISIYKNFIYVVPNGPQVTSSNETPDSDAIQAAVNAKIQQELDDSGINTNVYTITNINHP